MGAAREQQKEEAEESPRQHGKGDKAEGGSAAATVYLSHLRSYEGMGTADVRCVAGCACRRSSLDGTWDRPVALQQIHRFSVSVWGGGWVDGWGT